MATGALIFILGLFTGTIFGAALMSNNKKDK